jgi:hypothetical protein
MIVKDKHSGLPVSLLGLLWLRLDKLSLKATNYTADGTVGTYSSPVFEYCKTVGNNRSDFPYFKEAEESSLNEMERLLNERYECTLWRTELRALFLIIHSGMPLEKAAAILHRLTDEAVANNDRGFFLELANDYSTRESLKTKVVQVTPLTFCLLSCWTDKLLWLMTDFAAWLFLREEMGFVDLEEATYTKARQRANLMQHPKLQPISGYSRTSGPIWRCGDLDTYLKTLSS